MALPDRIAADRIRRADEVRDILALVMEKPPSRAMVMAWSGDQRERAIEWAAREHLSASDNANRRIKRPAFL